MTVAARALDVMSLTLNVDIPAGVNLRRDATPAWDSLKHIELIFALEEEFRIHFNLRAMEELVDLDAIIAAVRRLIGSELPDAA